MTNPAVSRTCDFCSDFSSIDKTTNKESIKNLPLEDRPREKLFLRGVEALTDAELLAILLRTQALLKNQRWRLLRSSQLTEACTGVWQE